MICFPLRQPVARAAIRAAALVSLAGVSLVGGCGILDVSNPTAIENQELDDAVGADLLRDAALGKFFVAFQATAKATGLMGDELFSDPDPIYEQQSLTSGDRVLDQRDAPKMEQYGTGTGAYSGWHETRVAASVAIERLRSYAPTTNPVGEMFAVRGFATLQLGETTCPGFPLHRVVNFVTTYGGPLTNEEVLEQAVADFDTAIVNAADSAEILNFARVGRARALLDLGRFAEAGAAVAGVPDGYAHNALYEATLSALWNRLAMWTEGDIQVSVADRDGGTGLDYISSGDPRIGAVLADTSWDGETEIYGTSKYSAVDAPIVLASGVEARLIEAEAALQAGSPNWRTILNTLRATSLLDSLVDPGSDTARVSMLFRERAFWLFGTGHRLGDMRRLVRQYGRAAAEVYPAGAYRLGGVYGDAMSLVFNAAAEKPFSPSVTGCTGP